MDFKNIAIGLINATRVQFGMENKFTEEIAMKRYEICLQCPLIKYNNTICGSCGCILALKVRSGAKCPTNRW